MGYSTKPLPVSLEESQSGLLLKLDKILVSRSLKLTYRQRKITCLLFYIDLWGPIGSEALSTLHTFHSHRHATVPIPVVCSYFLWMAERSSFPLPISLAHDHRNKKLDKISKIISLCGATGDKILITFYPVWNIKLTN